MTRHLVIYAVLCVISWTIATQKKKERRICERDPELNSCRLTARVMRVNIWNIYFELRMKDQIEEKLQGSFFYLIFQPQFKIYVSYIYFHLFILHRYVMDSQYDQLPVGLIAQLVEHCTSITESFFQAFFSQLLKLRTNCEDLSSIWFLWNSSHHPAILNFCYVNQSGILLPH